MTWDKYWNLFYSNLGATTTNRFVNIVYDNVPTQEKSEPNVVADVTDSYKEISSEEVK